MLPINVTLYRWAGSLGPFRITTECSECDCALAGIREVMSAHPDWPVQFEIKPWLDHAWEALRYGGWHAPVVVVSGQLVSQGKIPSCGALERAIRHALEPPRERKSGFWSWLKGRVPRAPS